MHDCLMLQIGSPSFLVSCPPLDVVLNDVMAHALGFFATDPLRVGVVSDFRLFSTCSL